MIKTLEVGKMIKSIKSMKVKKRKRTHEHNLNNLSYDPYGEVPTLVTLSIDWLLENGMWVNNSFGDVHLRFGETTLMNTHSHCRGEKRERERR